MRNRKGKKNHGWTKTKKHQTSKEKEREEETIRLINEALDNKVEAWLWLLHAHHNAPCVLDTCMECLSRFSMLPHWPCCALALPCRTCISCASLQLCAAL